MATPTTRASSASVTSAASPAPATAIASAHRHAAATPTQLSTSRPQPPPQSPSSSAAASARVSNGVSDDGDDEYGDVSASAAKAGLSEYGDGGDDAADEWDEYGDNDDRDDGGAPEEWFDYRDKNDTAPASRSSSSQSSQQQHQSFRHSGADNVPASVTVSARRPVSATAASGGRTNDTSATAYDVQARLDAEMRKFERMHEKFVKLGKFKNILNKMEYAGVFDDVDVQEVDRLQKQLAEQEEEQVRIVESLKNSRVVQAMKSMKMRIDRRIEVIEAEDTNLELFKDFPELCTFFVQRQAEFQRKYEESARLVSQMMQQPSPSL